MQIRFAIIALIGLGSAAGCGKDKTVPVVVTAEQEKQMEAEQKAVDQEERARMKAAKPGRQVDEAEAEERRLRR